MEVPMESLNRRSALVLGVALAPAIGLSQSVAAASMYGPDAGKEILPGIRQVDLGKWPINIATYKTAVVTDYIFAPGSGFPDEAMKNDMICQIMEGEIWVKQGDRAYTAKAGHVFACAKDTQEEDKNQSSATAVMRVIELMPT
jgi:quercetin dioxygenase-like cupin family protein